MCRKGYKNIKPDIVYTHHAGDLNVDHQITNRAVVTATRPLANCSVKKIYAYETVSSTEWNYIRKESGFCPNVFENVDEYISIKFDAMKKYTSELCEFPHPRSLRTLDIRAAYWGSTVGCNYAEAFELIRAIEK